VRVEGQYAGFKFDHVGEELHIRHGAVRAPVTGWAEVAEEIGRAKRERPHADEQNCFTHHSPDSTVRRGRPIKESNLPEAARRESRFLYELPDRSAVGR